MEITSVCLLISATLSIQPDRLQFFHHESINMSCAVSGNSSGWEVMRNASKPLEPCKNWGRKNGFSCINHSVYQIDSGLYWCQSERGDCRSNILDIQINSGVVILESPAHPVTEGEKVTLRCSHRERYASESSSNFPAKFFKNDVFIGEQPEGTMILNVILSDRGSYHCKHPTKGESLKNWLDVRVRAQLPDTIPPPPLISKSSLVCSILLFILYTIMFVVCLIIYWRWAQARADAKRKASDRLHPDY